MGLVAGVGDSDLASLDSAEEQLAELCAAAREHRLVLLLDAEQSHRQPAIDYMAVRLMRRFNRRRSNHQAGGSRPQQAEQRDQAAHRDQASGEASRSAPSVPEDVVLLNTYQTYLVNAVDKLRGHLALAEREGWVLGAKVVRGAYLVSEAEHAAHVGVPTPLHATKAQTDEAFDAAIALALDAVCDADCGGVNGSSAEDSSEAGREGRGGVSVMVATHNVKSVERLAERMEQLRIPKNHPHVHVAQIMGMCDHLTLALGTAGYNVHKLVLFGAFGDIMPWMLRRLDEQGDLLGATAAERHLMWAEVRRRWSPLSG